MIKKLFLQFYDKSFVYFLIIGGANTFISLALMFACYNALGLGYWVSSAAAFAICSVISYILNRKLSFKSNAPVLTSAIKFAIVIIVCYTLAFGIAKPAAFYIAGKTGLDLKTSLIEQCAMLLAQCIFTFLNFLGQKLWAFRG